MAKAEVYTQELGYKS